MKRGSLVAVAAAMTLTMIGCAGGDGVSRLVGARCDGARDCDERCLGPSNDYPEGMCSIDCDRSSDCTSETVCADKEGGVCLFACQGSRDCAFLGPRWTCREQNLRDDQNTKVNVCMGD